MPANIPPTMGDPPYFPNTLTVPVDSDPANASSVVTPLQQSLDGLTALRQSTAWRATRKSYSCLDGVNVTIGPLGRMFLLDSMGRWQTVTHANATISAATTLAGGALANNARYYIYAYINAGALAFAAVAEAPESTLSYRASSEQYLYVGTFVTNSVGSVIAIADNSGAAGAGLSTSGTTTFYGPIAASIMAFELTDPGNGGAIPVTTSGVLNMVAGAVNETRSLASPTFQGQSLLLTLSATGGGNITVTASSPINQTGNTVMTFSNQDFIKLEAHRSGGSQRWQVTANDGTGLS